MDYIKSRYGNMLYMFMGLIIFISSLIGLGIRFNNIVIVFFAAISFLCYYLFDVFDISDRENVKQGYVYALIINVTFIIILIGATKKIPEILIIYSIQLFYQTIIKYIFTKFFITKKKVVIIGIGEKNDILRTIIRNSNKYKFIGSISEDGKGEDNYRVLGNFNRIKEICEEISVDEIVIVSEKFDAEFIKEVLNLKLEGVKVNDFMKFFEKVTEKVPLTSIDEEWLLYSEGFMILGDFYQRVKRVFDIAIALIILIPSLPVMFLSAIIIRMESKGNIFFIQERIGKGGKPFQIMKFRSMRSDAEKNGPQWASEKDNRVTAFGSFMRKTRIDELPQLINILKGDMSFIGPRPERQHFIDMLEKEIPFYNLRHIIKPGLTGWAQVNYPYGASVEDAFEKLQFDLYYIKNYSMLLDVIIFFRTAKTVLFGKGR